MFKVKFDVIIEVMRIGIDCRLWEQTGVGRYTRNIVLNLQTIDINNHYVLFIRSEDKQKILDSGFDAQNKRWKLVEANIRWHSLSEQLRFPAIIRQQKLDLMHFPYFSVPIFYDKAYVVTIHDLIISHFATGKSSTLFYPLYLAKRQAYKKVIRQAAKKAKRIIVPSKATLQELIKLFKISENKIDVIYEAADDRIMQEPVTPPKFEKYFLYVGNAYPHKNLDRLIKAFKKISAEFTDIKLVLVGQKDYFYQRLEKENQSENIVFFGKASDSELASLYAKAVALVSPSLMEGFGLPVLEALSQKCLVLASDIPAFREIAADNALYFNPLEESDIYAKLKDVIQNEMKYRAEKLEKGYDRAQKFSWQKAAEQTLNVYESSLSL